MTYLDVDGSIFTLLGVLQCVEQDCGVECDVSDVMYIAHFGPWHFHWLSVVTDQGHVPSLDLIWSVHSGCLEVANCVFNVSWM